MRPVTPFMAIRTVLRVTSFPSKRAMRGVQQALSMRYEASLWTVVWTRPLSGRVVRRGEQRRVAAVRSPGTPRRRTAHA
ncbi:hypothetical protein SAM23877_2778 [Streptomyces ambofaciens ATCC 23877]|uniref:Uncharacterized protein n=1 Tax=Streptomyces ambofaciens (strain ATCC 23877 / 3486 / DSM 40053 / JCM 4204 / NBRC 12836 / NRRL B-2516) TaxID=278992 RepID=A0A0K2ASM4_STRA7|nr:hypothetical protein SAM23877_2778 [Streptomyces ambofaciens ATCC 23877]